MTYQFTIVKPQRHKRALIGQSVRPLRARSGGLKRAISVETVEVFHAISDASNVQVFSKDALLDALKHIEA